MASRYKSDNPFAEEEEEEVNPFSVRFLSPHFSIIIGCVSCILYGITVSIASKLLLNDHA